MAMCESVCVCVKACVSVRLGVYVCLKHMSVSRKNKKLDVYGCVCVCVSVHLCVCVCVSVHVCVDESCMNLSDTMWYDFLCLVTC